MAESSRRGRAVALFGSLTTSSSQVVHHSSEIRCGSSRENRQGTGCRSANPYGTTPDRARMTADVMLSRQLWRWYIVVFIANELDLVFTYFGLGQGFLHEANPLLRPHIYTLWPIAIKILALAGLALGIAAAVNAGFARKRRVLRVLHGVAAIYCFVLILHLFTILRAIGG